MAALLFILFWHHHHKPFDPLAAPIDGERCERVGDLYSFAGPDGATGFSPLSCAAAYGNWRITPAPKRAMNFI